MALKAGDKLGSFEILSAIGAGGQGEVYKARDTRLDRFVAIKVLPTHLSSRQDLHERFEREARAVSSLNHPHICTLHDIGKQDGTDYLVMEYLEGQTLADRLVKGPLPTAEALRYAIEIADALDKAHRQGVTHRDLKPGNIMLTKSGATLLDFGLAKLKSAPSADMQMSNMPTGGGAADLTAQGTILGTLQYMSPEQLEGKEADSRSDVFSFGSVLYEMLTGKMAFEGGSQANVIAAILQLDPAAPSGRAPMTPALLDHVVERCLAKDPDARWQSAGDLMNVLRWILQDGVAPKIPIMPARNTQSLVWTVAVAVIFSGLCVLGAWRLGTRSGDQPVLMLSVMPPAKSRFDLYAGAAAISPDGKRIVFPATDDRNYFLYLRDLDSLETETLYTENCCNVYPFWSPDGQFVAFVAQGKLKKVELSSKVVQDISNIDINDYAGGSWGSDGTILIGHFFQAALSRVPASGGTLEPATALDESRNEIAQFSPYFLPDGDHFLYTSRSSKPDESGIYVGSLHTKESKLVLKADSMAIYGSGHLLFMKGRTLMAQPFDVQRLELSGEAMPTAQNVDNFSSYDQGSFSVSKTGVLAYSTGGATPVSQLTWFDLKGKPVGLVGTSFHYALGGAMSGKIQLSPDEKRVAVEVMDTDLLKGDLWITDLLSGAHSRLTLGPAWENLPAWSPNGDRIAYSKWLPPRDDLYIRDSSGAGKEERISTESTKDDLMLDWSRDGEFILFDRLNSSTQGDIWILSLAGPAKAHPLIQSDADESEARFSPDGKWIAYVSNQSGRYEVYVQSFPAGEGRWQISTDGGEGPRWRGDSKELYYIRADGTFMAAALTGATFQSVLPQPLFKLPPTHGYDVTKDGQRFLINVPVGDPAPWPITVVTNWPATLSKK